MEKGNLHLKQFFIVETSVFLDKNVQKIRFFTAKNTVLSLKYKFYHRKRGFLMEKGTLHLKQNFIVETSVILQSWRLIFAQMRNVAKKCFSANVPKVFIFGLPVRTGTINDFSCKDWVLGSYWHSYMFQANDHMT